MRRRRQSLFLLVSKYHEQSNVVQAKALYDADCCRIFEKAASGAGWDRPELHRMHLRLRPPVVID